MSFEEKSTWAGLLTVALVGLGMAMYEMAHFWIANTLLLGLVMAELVGGCAKLYLYRRGF